MGKLLPSKQTPFIVSTSILAVLGWVLAFSGACLLKVLNGAWWIIIYELFITVGHVTVFLRGLIPNYRLAMVMFLASSIPLLTIQIDYVLQSNRPSMKKVAADIYAAGYIILVLVQYLWALVIGSEPNTALGKLGQKANDEKNVLNRFESNTTLKDDSIHSEK